MRLTAFRVQSFRSVDDSGWIEVDDVTTLIGTNESGKTNLLVPLWKLKPAKEGDIKPLADYPRKRYGEIRNMKQKPRFISARFIVPDELLRILSNSTEHSPEDLGEVEVHRDLDGDYSVDFIRYKPQEAIPAAEVEGCLRSGSEELSDLAASSREEPMKEEMLESLKSAIASVPTDWADLAFLQELEGRLRAVDVSKAIKASILLPRFEALQADVTCKVGRLRRRRPEEIEGVLERIVQAMPAFVFYSNYGNLDSEIYLPHVIENLERADLGQKEEAKARTLKVLFEFVHLSPREILELGRDLPTSGRPTDDQITSVAEKKREREVLLQSASSMLTDRFRDWWKQGDYRFRFDADGDHFRIWVSDDRRPEEIELESRSTGLQWFLSFYLVFLVESQDAHAGTILLLDEAGLSLHPIAQRDLSQFFEGLAETNQLVFTTHSPFLVDPDHLDRVRAVYVDDHGFTAVSPDLRGGESNSAATKSVYAVHAALGLSVSHTFLDGCNAIVVEGPADQRYLSAIKNHLIGRGRISPARELVFLPAGGVRGVKAVVSIVASKADDLPPVVLDGDEAGRSLKDNLLSGLYSGHKDLVLSVDELVGIEGAEIEDLFPTIFLARVVARHLPRPSGLAKGFDEEVVSGTPIVPQIETWADAHDITLGDGWKVDVATLAKKELQADPDGGSLDDEKVAVWQRLFERLLDGKG